MQHPISLTLGLDIGDRVSHYCILEEDTGEIIDEGKVRTTRDGLRELFDEALPMRVVLETGGQSPWISALVEECGHESIVAQASRVRLIYRNDRKCDRVDAQMLARLGRMDPSLLSPIRHRGERAQGHRAYLKSRNILVRTRTTLVLHCRGTVKGFGGMLPACSTKSFHYKVRDAIPPALRLVLQPVLAAIELLTTQITELDRTIGRLCDDVYPETQRLTQVPGVGKLTALAFVLTIEDPHRFGKARNVGAYLGMVPRRDQSGGTDKQLRITKAGDRMMRTLLVQSAHYHIGHFGDDTAISRWAHARLDRGGAGMKKRTTIAVARRLAVLLLRLWLSGERYEPLRGVLVPAPGPESESAAA